MSFSINKKYWIWITWATASLLLFGYLGYRMLGDDKTVYVTGIATDGHHQIEQKCELCHTKPFGGGEVIQDACVNCHGDELKHIDDSHPKSKFVDPRNAALVSILDARYCSSCHVEHQQPRTRAMGVTLPDDFCYRCHQDIGNDRASHKDLPFNGCASAGCHNYHDNRSLYEDFLVKQGRQPDLLANPQLPQRNLAEFFYRKHGENARPLSINDIDAAGESYTNPVILGQWATSAHAGGGVNCSVCHQPGKSSWSEKPGTAQCQSCHQQESKGFSSGKHGMRDAAGLGPMSPALARIPMHKDARDKSLDCNSCHNPHSVDLVPARVDSCLQCHNDEHSVAYNSSPHAQVPKGKGKLNSINQRQASQQVTCASCHMPRLNVNDEGIDRIMVQHNQNDNLRPNEKMARQICLQCHGMQFTLDSLADKDLIKRNFTGRAKTRIPSIDWALLRGQSSSKPD